MRNTIWVKEGGRGGGRANELSRTVHAAACLIKPPNDIKNTVFRDEATLALAGFILLLYLGQIGICSNGFCGGRKTAENPEKTP